jgi:hypothetical protein
MNERIKELAKQAGLQPYYDKEFIRFAELVRQDERQAIKQAEKESTLQEMSDIGQDIEWDTSDMAHRSGGLSVEQEKLCKYCGGIGRVVCGGKCMPEQEPWDTSDMAHRSGGLTIEQEIERLKDLNKRLVAAAKELGYADDTHEWDDAWSKMCKLFKEC